MLFLGHPAYALTVVLFALLLFSGLGSLPSGRFEDAALVRRLRGAILAVVGLVVLAVLLLAPLFYALGRASTWPASDSSCERRPFPVEPA